MYDVFELIMSRISSLSDVKSLSLDPKLSKICGNLNDEELLIINEFYQAKGFRKLHLEVAKLGKSLEILHCVFFPDPCYELPIFGVDLVISSKNISAAIVDLSPVGKHLPGLVNEKMKALNISQFKETRNLPDWGCIFSPYVCFIKPSNLSEEKLFLKLIEDYLSILFSLLVSLKPDESSSTDTIHRLKYQKRYCHNQKLNDKTRVILTRFFGSSWANEYIDEILFKC